MTATAEEASILASASAFDAPIDLRKIVEGHLATARLQLDTHGEMSHAFYAYEHDKIQKIDVDFEDQMHKALVIHQIEQYIGSLHARAALFVGDAWLRPLDDRSKVVGETIVVAARSAHEYCEAGQSFSRNSDGSITFGEEIIQVATSENQLSNWFADCRFAD